MNEKDQLEALKEELEIQKEKLEKLNFYVFWLESQIRLEELKKAVGK